MRKNLRDRLGKEWLFCDGGMGTFLQERGLQGGELPERWNLTHPDIITELFESYLKAGADIFNTNSFGLNSLKYISLQNPLSRAIFAKILAHVEKKL